MAITKTEIIASAIIVLSLVTLFIIDAITSFIYHKDNSTIYPASLFQIITWVAALICLAICCLHFRRTLDPRWKMLIVGVFLGSAGAFHSLRFLSSPQRWNFEFRMIFSIDMVGMVVFFLVIFIRDTKITISLALFASSLIVLYINIQNFEQFTLYLLFVLSIVIYLVLYVIHVMYFIKQWWKKVMALISSVTVIMVIRLAGINVLSFFIPVFDAILALDLSWKIYTQNARYQEMLRDDQYNVLEMAGLPTRFTIKELETATENFQMPIGEGGSGAVFKGTLEDGSIVAVKSIKGHASGEAEFRTEITIIASLQHISLVRLLGYCLTTRGDRYLIYPFFENGSLDAWIFKGEEKRAHLTWMYRYLLNFTG